MRAVAILAILNGARVHVSRRFDGLSLLRERTVTRLAAIALMLAVLLPVACNPKPVVVPGYFSQQRPANAPPTCEGVLACYARCGPPAEDCMLLCDQCGVSRDVARARAVSNCAAIKGCDDDPVCREQQCAPELATCKARHIGGPPVIDTFCPKP